MEAASAVESVRGADDEEEEHDPERSSTSAEGARRKLLPVVTHFHQSTCEGSLLPSENFKAFKHMKRRGNIKCSFPGGVYRRAHWTHILGLFHIIMSEVNSTMNDIFSFSSDGTWCIKLNETPCPSVRFN